jgi:hypothetical protein
MTDTAAAVTPADVINAATDVLDGITTGTLSAADVEASCRRPRKTAQ